MIQVLLAVQKILHRQLRQSEQLDKVGVKNLDVVFALQTIIHNVIYILVDCGEISFSYHSIYVDRTWSLTLVLVIFYVRAVLRAIAQTLDQFIDQLSWKVSVVLPQILSKRCGAQKAAET